MQYVGGLLQCQAGEIPELDQLRLNRFLGGQFGQGFIYSQQIVRDGVGGSTVLIQVNSITVAAMFDSAFTTGAIDQDSPHRLGGRGKKVPATVPMLGAVPTDQPQISFVDQRGRLERLSGLFFCHPLRGKAAQFAVDERQELLGSLRIALVKGGQDAGDFVHSAPHK